MRGPNEPWIEERCSYLRRGMICGTDGKMTTVEFANACQFILSHGSPVMRRRTSGEDVRGEFIGGVYLKAQESVAVAHPCQSD
jgi:hypothetical protein